MDTWLMGMLVFEFKDRINFAINKKTNDAELCIESNTSRRIITSRWSKKIHPGSKLMAHFFHKWWQCSFHIQAKTETGSRVKRIGGLVHAIGVGHELSRLAKSALRAWLQRTCELGWHQRPRSIGRAFVNLTKKRQNILGFYFNFFFFLQYLGHFEKKSALCAGRPRQCTHVMSQKFRK